MGDRLATVRRAAGAALVLCAVTLARAGDQPHVKPLTETTTPTRDAEEPARRLPAVVTICQDAARGCWSESGEHGCRSAATPAATVFRIVIVSDASEAVAACKAARAQ
jgi:hypothetical protein